ncbi:MAG: 16S rRNA (uracil(1498)-N(3))-methyltransferase [Betaproteobacteria bacterium]
MPRPPRFFISHDQVFTTHILVSGEDVPHIATVLRMKIGDEILLCDGQGAEYLARISSLNKKEVKAEVVSQSKRDVSSPRIILGQGLPKSDKMDFIVQKATELGVADIVPLITERTIVKVKDEEKRIIRWQKIAREAAMQSNRLDIPRVERMQTITNFVRTLEAGPRTLLVLPWEEGTEPIKNVLRQNPDVKNIVVLIGPEGGFSSAEAAMAKEEGFHLVSLGPNILRTETAAIAVLSMIGYEFF